MVVPILIADELIDEKESQYDEGVEKDLENADEVIFGPERDLQAALRSNIEQLKAGLSIIDEGTERSTQAGRIDIT
jgi:RecB family endonuclease NucS